MTLDLAIIETGNGGDIQLQGNDLALVYGIENQPYLGLFGGNPGFVTDENNPDEQSFDYWGNALCMPGAQAMQMNSLFEYALGTTALTSNNRIVLENFIKKDLEFLSEQTTVDISVSIIATDVIQIKLGFILPEGGTKIKVVQFRKTTDGDWTIPDFNDDFYL